MGLYIKIHKNFDRKEEIMLSLFHNLVERLNIYLNFIPTSDYTLWNEFLDEEEIWSAKIFESETIFNIIEKHRKDIKEKTGTTARFSISIEGIIQLKDNNGELGNMLVDIIGTCSDFKDLYGNVWIYFYNTSTKWQSYFIGSNEYSIENTKKLMKLINDIAIPDFNLYSIYFADSNVVFDVLNKAYYIYFKEYKYFIETILEIIKNRLTEENLEYEDILISESKRPLLSSIKIDLSLFELNELTKIIDLKSSDFSHNYQQFVSSEYKGNVIYSTKGSVEIYDKHMNPKTIRNAFTDYIGNFLTTLDEVLPEYNDMERQFHEKFTKHQFEPEKKEKQKKLQKFM